MIPTIRPISELKNTTSIASLCHELKEPVFITKNGYSDLVIMSIDTYERKITAMQTKTIKKSREAMFGCLRGEYKIADDFDAPLEDFKEYME